MEPQHTKSVKVKVNEALSQFIHNNDFPVDVKDCNGRYTENNALAAMVSGLEPNDRIGLDIYDLAQINHMPDGVIQKIIAADQKVHPDHGPVQLQHAFLNTQSQQVVVDKVVKQAVVDNSGHMVGILSFAKEMTAQIDRVSLYHLYKNYYPTEEAITYFLNYLNIKNFFSHMPSDMELNTLLLGGWHVEKIAKYLQLSTEVVHSARDSVQDKLVMIDFKELTHLLSLSHSMEK